MDSVKPDLFVAWPISFDYPRFRKFIVSNRNKFNKVIISFTETNMGTDYRSQLRKLHSDWIFIDPVPCVDWFDGAVQRALPHFESDYVLFMEQDFVCDLTTIDDLLAMGMAYNFVCYVEGQRKHFCCFLLKRSCIDLTSKFFGLTSGLDNFDFFVNELTEKSKGHYAFLSDITYGKYHHLNGLTHNYHLAMDKHYEALVRPEEFKEYNNECLNSEVEQILEWVEIMKTIKEDLK